MKFPVLPLALILGLPLAGLWGARKDIMPFMAFPPRPVVPDHAPFSWSVFIIILTLILAVTLPLIRKGMIYRPGKQGDSGRPMPGWGKLALVSLCLFWGLAWTRFTWFAPLQPHTFFPLWLSLILVINGLTMKRSGTCPLTARPHKFLLLFPVSALFWWVFEYLNRFVGNWYYTGSQYPAFTYFLLATLSFSTVLPAVESMKAWLMSFARIRRGFKQSPVRLDLTGTGIWLMILGGISLSLIGIFPDPLFFTVWISPFLIILGHGILRGHPHPFEGLAKGDLTLVVAYAAAALICGIFWEFFNFYSLARWVYTIPYVQVIHLFEMPVLGYAGYLPFGLECGLIIHIIYTFDRLEPHDS